MYDEHAGALHSYLSRRVGRQLADDLLADTFRIAIEDWGAYDPAIGSARTWLYGIATNLVRRHWRTERRRHVALGRIAAQPPTVVDSLPTPERDVVEHLAAVDDVERLLAAVAALDADDRDLLVLTAWENISSATSRRRSTSLQAPCDPVSTGSDDSSMPHVATPQIDTPIRKVVRHEFPR